MKNRKELGAEIMLLFVSMSWGITYILLDVLLEQLPQFTLNACRFLVAFAITYTFSFKKMRNISKETMRLSLAIGVALFFMYLGTNLGVKYTSVTNAGFLCSLSVAFVPILNMAIDRKRPEKKMVLVILMSVASIALLTLNGATSFAIGDLFCIMCSLAFSVDIVIMERGGKNASVDPFQVGILQLLFCGLFNGGFALITEDPCIPVTTQGWIYLLILSVVCTGMAFIFQSLAQKHTSSAKVGVLLGLDPIFSTISAVLFAGEILTPRTIVSGILMLAGLVIMESNISFDFVVRKRLS